jgi:Homeodomain
VRGLSRITYQPRSHLHSTTPLRNMDVLGSLCQVCYGLAIDCSYCSATGLQPTGNPWDLGDCRVDSCSGAPDNSSHPLVGDYASPEGHAERLLQLGYEEDSEFYGASLELSSDKPSNLVTLEQKDKIPAYRRHTKSKAQVKLLKDWFAANPNPTGPQLSEYAKLASLEKDQVRNWFVNQRRPSRNPLSKKTSKAEFKRKTSSKGHPKQCKWVLFYLYPQMQY